MPDKEPNKEEGATDSSDTPKEPVNSIDRANEAIDRMKAENDRTEELVKRQEALKTDEILGGKSDAGKEPEQPKEDTDAEYAAKVMRGEEV